MLEGARVKTEVIAVLRLGDRYLLWGRAYGGNTSFWRGEGMVLENNRDSLEEAVR